MSDDATVIVDGGGIADTPVTAEYLRDAETRAMKFQGAWTGTSGTLAADVKRLVDRVRELDAALHACRSMHGGSSGKVRPGTDRFLAVLEEVARLHVAKSLDYGEDEDALTNIRAGARTINVDAWKGCVLRISDKLQRISAYCRRGRVEFDGIEDTLLDCCAYAAIALVTFRELQAPLATTVGCDHEASHLGRVGDGR